MPIRKFKPRRKVARRPMKKMYKKTTRAVEHATIRETQGDSTGRNVITANVDYPSQFNISQFPRALSVAKNFKFYRAKYVVWEYRSDYNVFQENGSAVTKPYIFWAMNRTGDQTLQTLQGIQEQGAKPHSWTGIYKIKYKPNLGQVVNVAEGASNVTHMIGLEPAYDKWLATQYAVQMPPVANSDQVQPAYNFPNYLGHTIVAAQDTPITNQELGVWTCTVTWEFKDPQPIVNTSP